MSPICRGPPSGLWCGCRGCAWPKVVWLEHRLLGANFRHVGSIVFGNSEVRIEGKRLVKIRNCQVELVFKAIRNASVVECFSKIRIKRNRFIQVLDRQVILTLEDIRTAATIKSFGQVRTQRDLLAISCDAWSSS